MSVFFAAKICMITDILAEYMFKNNNNNNKIDFAVNLQQMFLRLLPFFLVVMKFNMFKIFTINFYKEFYSNNNF